MEGWLCRGTVEQVVEAARASGATSLDLSDRRLSHVLNSVRGLIGLTELNLAYNQLTELPDTIGNLAQLMRLYLQDNRLTSLPPRIQEMARRGPYVVPRKWADMYREKGN
jgi:Leucine-rich repeat (LRR) protein